MKRLLLLLLATIAAIFLLIFGGGKPSRGTPADKRLAANKPKPAPQQTRITKAVTPPTRKNGK